MSVDSSQFLNRIVELEKSVDDLVEDMQDLKRSDNSERFDTLEDSVAIIKSHQVSLERTIESFRNELAANRNHIQEVQITAARLLDTVEKIKSMEGELKIVREKLVRYELKLEAIDQIKALLMWLAGLMIPACGGALIELGKFLLGLHG